MTNAVLSGLSVQPLKLGQRENALLPIETTVDGRETLTKSVQ